jgi:hypothetical protein
MNVTQGWLLQTNCLICIELIQLTTQWGICYKVCSPTYIETITNGGIEPGSKFGCLSLRGYGPWQASSETDRLGFAFFSDYSRTY